MSEDNNLIPFKPFNRDEWDREKQDALRDPKTGKWLPGTPSPNKKGRPKRDVEMSYLEAVHEIVNEVEWAKAINAIMRKAQSGDVSAFNTLRDMVAGKPTERIAVVDDSAEQEIELTFQAERKTTIDINSEDNAEGGYTQVDDSASET